MSIHPESNRSIFRSLSLFSGVQALKAVIGLVQTKAIAYFVGLEGVGLLSVFRGILSIMDTVFSGGLSPISVREITRSAHDSQNYSKSLTIMFAWSIIIGLLGTLLMALFSPLLSYFSFGDFSYTSSFVYLALVIVINALSSFYLANLQGLGRLRLIALISVVTSLFSMIASVLIYYGFGIRGIVWSIVSTSVIAFVVVYMFSASSTRLIKFVTFKELFVSHLHLIKLGGLVTLSALLANLSFYLVKVFVVQKGGLETAGLYQAGLTIFESYLSVIFIAMATDYYPKLTLASNNHKAMSDLVNRQALVSLLVLLPIILLLIPFIPLVVKLLYSSTFLPAKDYILWSTLGVFFKAGSWTMGYVLFAKGNFKYVFYDALIFGGVFYGMNHLFFSHYGLNGLGIAYSLYFILHFIGMVLFVKIIYNISFSRKYLLYLLISLLFCSVVIYAYLEFSQIVVIFTTGTLLLLSFYLAYKNIWLQNGN